nr:hypothetical protein [Tanacetum cinerariifolium]
MTSFGYRLNPRYAIKECLSCGALYTGDFCCSKGSVEDKILVPKPTKNCARCAKCGHPNISESSDDSTNVVNAPREPVELAEYINTPGWNRPAFYDNDDDDDDVDYTIAITPVLSTEEPIDSLSMGDEHLDTIPATGSDEDFSESNDEFSSTDNDSFSIDNIDYVEASPPDSELVSLEEVKDDNLREKLMNINLFIAKIKSLNVNPTPDHVLKYPSPSPIPVEDRNSFLEKSDTSLLFRYFFSRIREFYHTYGKDE